jgi:hypothetical protein
MQMKTVSMFAATTWLSLFLPAAFLINALSWQTLCITALPLVLSHRST